MRFLRGTFLTLLCLRLLLIVLHQMGIVTTGSTTYQSVAGDPAGQQDIASIVTKIKSAVAPAPAPKPLAEPVAPAPVARTPVVWTPPAVIPAIPGGTLTTPDTIYFEARIVKVDPDRVTIAHQGGRAVVPMWQLPSSLQQQLNYSPQIAETAAAQRQATDAPVEEALARQDAPMPQALARQDAPNAPLAPTLSETTDYSVGLASAKASGRKVLLHFTGSDWCGYCQLMEKEVLSTSTFNQFAASNYVIVTLDFPHNIPLPANLKDQNDRLAQKYHVDGYPTLVVITPDERELGRLSGYSPGAGPDDVIGHLRGYNAAP